MTRRSSAALLASCLVAVWAVAGIARAEDAELESYRVVRVLDGDTLDVEVADGTERIRLLGVNAPESHECMGPESAAMLASLVGKAVSVSRDGQDRSGRTLAHLFARDGRHVQREIVVAGLALAVRYGRVDEHTPRLEEAQEEARSGRIGMFAPGACGSLPHPGAGDLRVAEVDANPDGDDLRQGAGESVLIEGRPGQSLAGWTLRDISATHRFRFGEESALDESGQLRVYTSCGDRRAGAEFWCRKGSAVWNNTGDTAYLLDPDGSFVAWLDYDPAGGGAGSGGGR
jgi:endonuclease YncB( thermonuclease family)